MKDILRKIITNFYSYKLIFKRGFRVAHKFAYYYEKAKIKDNYIFYSSQCGNSWNGNPLAILDYLLNNSKYNNFFHVILYNNLNDKKVEQYKKKYKNVLFISTNSNLYPKYAESCKYLIVDNTLSPYFIKKPGQTYVNSWHSTMLKTLGKDTGLIWETDNISKNCLHIDYFISPNKFTSDLFFNAYYTNELFNGEIVETGYPRNDLIFNADKAKIRELLGINQDVKLIVYAPTWRGTISNQQKNADVLLEHFNKIKENLDKNYIILFRPHIMTYRFLTEKQKKYIVPMDIDTNELLAVTDILITDYSGILFDYMITKKPLILFPFDEKEYIKNRNSGIDFYMDLKEIPAPICYTDDEVVKTIKNIDEIQVSLEKSYQKFTEKFVPFDDGNATKRVVDKIFSGKIKKSVENNKKKILICPGNLNGNGVTESFITLLNNIDYNKYHISVLLEEKLKNQDKQLRINKNTSIFYNAENFMYKNILEYYLTYLLVKFGKQKWLPLNKKFCRRNTKSRFGSTEFDCVIEYHGYNPFNALIHNVGFFSVKNKIIYLHADMNLDRLTKNKKIKSVFTYYKYYNKLVCVSKGSLEANLSGTKNYILKKYGIDLTEKFYYLYNLVNLEKIESCLKSKSILFQGEKYCCCNIKLDDKLTLVKVPKKDDISFMTIGRVSPEKNHILLIMAFYKLSLLVPNIKLYISGDGILSSKIKKMIINLSLEDKVIMTDYIDNPYTLLNHCDYFVFPSQYEGMGLAALEACVLGKYVIASNIPGVRDIIDEESGMLVSLSEDAFYEAMYTCIKEKRTAKSIDGKKFNENAINLFYNIIDKE